MGIRWLGGRGLHTAITDRGLHTAIKALCSRAHLQIVHATAAQLVQACMHAAVSKHTRRISGPVTS